MITASQFIDEATRQGFDFYTGVPCSFLTSLINGILNDRTLRYIGATSEGEAVAIASGAWLAGRQPVVMCQNSGLGNTVNPLTSLNAPFRIPSLLITAWRGQPGLKDEPQHEVMGTITHKLLSLVGVEHAPFPASVEDLPAALQAAKASMAERQMPFALVMAKGSVEDVKLRQSPLGMRERGRLAGWNGQGERPRRIDVLERLLQKLDDETAVIASTGKCGRELFTLADRPQHLYQVGSMGGASAMGLGLALNTARTVVVLDGDGAALMKMGNLATVGAYGPGNLVHIVLDNGVHDSTGGQATVPVDFAAIALACGYRYAASCDSLAGFGSALAEALEGEKPALVHVRILPGSLAKLGRPTVAPVEVARRFKAFVAGEIAPARQAEAGG